MAGVVAALAAGTAATLVSGGTHAGGDDQHGLSPAALLVDDRTSALVAAAASLLCTAVSFFTAVPLTGATTADIVLAVVFLGPLPVAAALSSAWGLLCVVRLALSACRKAPLRLMGFLSEAHDRGVLRQAGGVYQFRHNLLQDHLAAVPPTGPAGPAGP